MSRNAGIIVYQAQLSADPATPAAGFSVIYPKTDGCWYQKFSDGTVICLTPVNADISLDHRSPAVDEVITANYSASVIRKYTITSGKKLTIMSGAIFAIL